MPKRSINARAVASEIPGIPARAPTPRQRPPGASRGARARAAPLLTNGSQERRVCGVSGTNHGDAEVGDRHETASDRVGVPRPLVEIVALDEQEWGHGNVADAPDL